VSVDFSGMEKLRQDLHRAQRSMLPAVSKVVSKGALNVKGQILKDFLSSKHFKGGKSVNWASVIKYDLEGTESGAKAEIGPYLDQDGFGTLVGIAIHGGSRGGGGTVADPLIALQAEEPRFVSAMEALGGKILNE